jgi:predicted enzyme related to lactoylglutathione lyase
VRTQVAPAGRWVIWCEGNGFEGEGGVPAIDNEIGGIFVPVRDIAAARDWYCGLLGLATDGPIHFGHIYVVPMRAGSGLVLDSKNFAGPHDRKPAFHFNTDDLGAARARAVEHGATEIGEITDGAFFTFKDPDGNLLMVADVPEAARK